MAYEVPDVQLIEQDKDKACWFASAMMVLNWAERNRPNPNANQSVAPDDETMALYRTNDGLQNSEIVPLAQRLGLVSVPPQSPSIQGLTDLLTTYGPLWTNGKTHIVIIAGIRGDDDNGYEVKVYDPWPGTGVGWRSLTGWYAGFNPGPEGASSADTSDAVEAIFLHTP